MKNIKLTGYTINLDAINPVTKKPVSSETLYFLNQLGIVYRQAAEFNRGNGAAVTAQGYDNNADILYDLLCAEGFFDDK